jgi:late competence protein required for DNA uptake (superfamily II DNA/RNA helicase)
MSDQEQKESIERFRSGKANLMIAKDIYTRIYNYKKIKKFYIFYKKNAYIRHI